MRERASRGRGSGTRHALEREVRRYLRTGEYDHNFARWPGRDYVSCTANGKQAMQEALVAEVRRLESGRTLAKLPDGYDPIPFARQKVTPMVKGLFPAKECETILRLLERSVVFLTHENIEAVLREQRWLGTAWSLANLYLGSIGSRCLSGEESHVVGIGQETNCYVSTAYFTEEDPFADFVLHEAAHVFHNWKRERAGLPHTRYQEWLLPIDFRKRETFAYGCEAYGRILERAKSRADRLRLHAEYAESWVPSANHLDQDELVDILAEAVDARNGWKRILKRCAPPKRVPRSVWLEQISREAVVRSDRG